jgi:hypothetical protein
MILEYNRMWGFRPTDDSAGGSGSGGSHIVIHYAAGSYVRIRHNVSWDGPWGYVISKTEEIGPIDHHDMHDNVLYDLTTGIKPRHIDYGDYYQNIFVSVSNWMNPLTSTAYNNTIDNNVFINCDLNYPASTYHSSNTIEANAYYNSTAHNWSSTSDGSMFYSNASDAEHDDLVITIKRITDPTQKTIPHGKVTSDSPHASWFGM